MRTYAGALAAALALTILSACGSSQSDDAGSEAGPWTFTDGRGEKITLDETPDRVVAQSSIAGALVELGVDVVGTFGPLKTEDGSLDPQAAGVDPTKVNYIAFSGGGEALAAILGGQVTVGISGYGEFESQIKSGALRIIGISSDAKVEGIDAPTFKEAGVDVSIQNWRMVAAAPGISAEQEAAIGADVEKLVKSKSWQDQLKAKGWADTYLAGDAFKAQLAKDTEATSAILKDIGLVK